MSETQRSWEARAEASGEQLSGVLFRGLSEQANAALHVWHAWVADKVFGATLKRSASVLDLGCGYGRLSKVLAHSRPDVFLIGQDLALGYSRMFHQNAGPCVCAEAEHLPFTDASFDGVLAVTCMMYAQRARAAQWLAGVHRVLKPGGTLLLLDPGLELQRWITRARPKRDHSPTGGIGFGLEEYRNLVQAARLKIVHEGGNPWLSAALLVPGVRQSGNARVIRSLVSCAKRNCRIGGYSALALHRWILAVRD